MALKKTKDPVTFESLVSTPFTPEPEKAPEQEDAPVGGVIRIKFLETGLTAAQKVWSAGEVFETEAGSPEYEITKDIDGNSWLDLAGDTEGQEKKFGKVFFEPA